MLISPSTYKSLEHVSKRACQALDELLGNIKEKEQLELDVMNLRIKTTVLMTFEGLHDRVWPFNPNGVPSSTEERVFQRGKRKWTFNPESNAPDRISKCFTQDFPIRKLSELSKNHLTSDLMKKIAPTTSYTLESINFTGELLDSEKKILSSFSPDELNFQPECVIECALSSFEHSSC